MRQASLRKLPSCVVTSVPPVDDGEGPRLAPSPVLLDAVADTSVADIAGTRGRVGKAIDGPRRSEFHEAAVCCS